MTANNPSRERRLIGALLRVPYHAVMHQVYADLERAGFDDLRAAHLVVFQTIELDGSRLTYLADRAVMTKQSMGYLVDYLEEHNYVERVPDPEDGRARLIRLTERGWQVQRQALQAVLDVEARWGARLGQQRLDQLIATLSELVVFIGDDPTSDFVPRVGAWSATQDK